MSLVFAAASNDVGATGSFIAAIMPFVVMLAVFYFILLRPQQQQQKKRKEMLESIKKGDRVVTVGGIHGEVTNVQGDELTVRIADRVEIRMSRSGIGQIKGK